MKKLSLIAGLILVLATTVKAQHYANPFFNEMGIARIQTSEYSKEKDTTIVTFHRMDDIIWSKTVYRIIDLRYKQNYQLYYPQRESDPNYMNLFKLIMKAIEDGLPVYDMTDYQDPINLKPNWNETMRGSDLALRLQDTKLEVDYTESQDVIDNSIRNASLLIYDEQNDSYTYNPLPFEAIAKNQIKYIILEFVFFDKHYSRLYTKIMAIAPLRSDRINYSPEDDVVEVFEEGEEPDPNDVNKLRSQNLMKAVREAFVCWIPFDALVPYLKGQYISPIQNETKRVTYDAFFREKLYSSYILGDDNMFSRIIIDEENAYTEKQMKKEQDRIAKEMLDFELDLWEY